MERRMTEWALGGLCWRRRRRTLSSVIAGCANISETFDPRGANLELSRVLLGIVLGEAVGRGRWWQWRKRRARRAYADELVRQVMG